MNFQVLFATFELQFAKMFPAVIWVRDYLRLKIWQGPGGLQKPEKDLKEKPRLKTMRYFQSNGRLLLKVGHLGRLIESRGGDMGGSDLGKLYRNGETIVSQGETGDLMYVVQTGQVEVLYDTAGREIRFTILNKGDIFGEMALFNREIRSATVRALGEARVLSVDKQTFLRRVHEDPSFAFRILQKMSERIRSLSEEVVLLKSKA